MIEWFTAQTGAANGLLILIGICSVVSMTVFIERLLKFQKNETNTSTLLIRLRQAIQEKSMLEALNICDQVGGSIATVIRTGLSRHQRTKEEIEAAMELSGQVEIAAWERNTKLLSMIAHLAPLIGLLGTVIGFIQAFAEMRLSGMVDISTTRLGEAMEFALVTTACGLAVAIPSVIAYNYLVSRIEQLALQMRQTASEVVDLLIYQDDFHAL
ncbi:MAG: MotA/TolQ/ExbB proton channel family protein [Chlamydiia bacterium]|nr:MotA/TolQ/ExbB proton channel family protein [Chlamydiia bacterium]